eukprot:g2450.t1
MEKSREETEKDKMAKTECLLRKSSKKEGQILVRTFEDAMPVEYYVEMLLMKKPFSGSNFLKIKRAWRERWFWTSNYYLCYGSTKGEVVSGVIDLRQISHAKILSTSKPKRIVMESIKSSGGVTGGDLSSSMHFKAGCAEDAEHFVAMINKRIKALPRVLGRIFRLRKGKGTNKATYVHARIATDPSNEVDEKRTRPNSSAEEGNDAQLSEFQKYFAFVQYGILRLYRKRANVSEIVMGSGKICFRVSVQLEDDKRGKEGGEGTEGKKSPTRRRLRSRSPEGSEMLSYAEAVAIGKNQTIDICTNACVRTQPRAALVFVEVKSAQNVKCSSLTDATDTYVQVRLLDGHRKTCGEPCETRVVPNSSHPEWPKGDIMSFRTTDCAYSTLIFDVWDKDLLSSTPLGRVHVSLRDVLSEACDKKRNESDDTEETESAKAREEEEDDDEADDPSTTKAKSYHSTPGFVTMTRGIEGMYDGETISVPLEDASVFDRLDLEHKEGRPDCFEICCGVRRLRLVLQAWSKGGKKDWKDTLALAGASMLKVPPSLTSKESNAIVLKGALRVCKMYPQERKPTNWMQCWAVATGGILRGFRSVEEEYEMPACRSEMVITALVMPPDGGWEKGKTSGRASLVTTIHSLKHVAASSDNNDARKRLVYCELSIHEGAKIVSATQRSMSCPVKRVFDREAESKREAETGMSGDGSDVPRKSAPRNIADQGSSSLVVEWPSIYSQFTFDIREVNDAFLSVLLWEEDGTFGRNFIGHVEVELRDVCRTKENQVAKRSEYRVIGSNVSKLLHRSGLRLHGVALLECDSKRKGDSRGIEIHGSGNGVLHLLEFETRVLRDRWVAFLLKEGCVRYADEVAKSIPRDISKDLGKMKPDDPRFTNAGHLEQCMGRGGSEIGIERWRLRYCSINAGVVFTRLSATSHSYRCALPLRDVTWIRWAVGSTSATERTIELLPSLNKASCRLAKLERRRRRRAKEGKNDGRDSSAALSNATEHQRQLLLRAPSRLIATKWMHALRLAQVASRAGLWREVRWPYPSWIETFDISTSPERLKTVFECFEKLHAASAAALEKTASSRRRAKDSGDVFYVVERASDLLGDLHDIARECKAMTNPRLDVLKFHVRYYHMQLVSIVEQHCHNPRMLSPQEITTLIHFMNRYQTTLRSVLKGTDLLETLQIDPHELENDYHNLIDRYAEVIEPAVKNVFARIRRNLLRSQVAEGAGMKKTESNDTSSVVKKNEIGNVYTMVPVDLFNIIYHHMKLARETGVEELQARILKISVGCLVGYQARLNEILRVTGAQADFTFAASVVNDCFSIMEELDCLRSEFEHIVEDFSIDFSFVTHLAFTGGIYSINCMVFRRIADLGNILESAISCLNNATRYRATSTKKENVGNNHAAAFTTKSSASHASPTVVKHRTLMNQFGGRLRVVLADSQKIVCDFYFRKLLHRVAREVVVSYIRAFYKPSMSVFTPFSISEVDVHCIDQDTKIIFQIFKDFAIRGSSFFDNRIKPLFEPLNVVREFVTMNVDDVGEAFDRVVRTHPYASISVYLVLRLSLMIRTGIAKPLRHKIMVAARDAALKTVEILGDSLETTTRRSQDIYYKIFPVSVKEVSSQRALGQMAHYDFMEHMHPSTSLDAAIKDIEA